MKRGKQHRVRDKYAEIGLRGVESAQRMLSHAEYVSFTVPFATGSTSYTAAVPCFDDTPAMSLRCRFAVDSSRA